MPVEAVRPHKRAMLEWGDDVRGVKYTVYVTLSIKEQDGWRAEMMS